MQAKKSKTLSQIDRRIQTLQEQLARLDPMRPGTLSRQYRQPRQKQGAYYQISYTYQMKSHTEYVPKNQVEAVRTEIAAYQRYKKLMGQWVDWALQRSRLRLKLAASAPSQSRVARKGSRLNVAGPKLKKPIKNPAHTILKATFEPPPQDQTSVKSGPNAFPAGH